MKEELPIPQDIDTVNKVIQIVHNANWAKNPLPEGWECSNPTLCVYDHSYLEPADFSGASDEVGFANDR